MWIYHLQSKIKYAICFSASLTLLIIGQYSIAATSIPEDVLKAMQSGTAQEVLVLFDTTEVKKNVVARRTEVDSRTDTPEILAFKSEQYQNIKARAFNAIGKDGIAILKDYKHIPMAFVRVENVSALKRIANDPHVVAINENIAFHEYITQSFPLISQPAAQALGKTGAGTTVAVLDTGIDYTMPIFGPGNGYGCSYPPLPTGCRIVYTGDFANPDGYMDDTMHGSLNSAIIARLAPGTNIAALDVFTWVGYNVPPVAYTADINDAIDWVISAQSTYNIVAMNLSFGGGSFSSECSGSDLAPAIAEARDAGVIPVIATGNDGYSNSVGEPACAPGAVRVGAVYDANVGSKTWSVCTDSTTAADKVACFSNSASFLTLLAPGSVISTDTLSGSGTSQAAPHVAGAIAILRAPNAFPGDSLDRTVERMTKTGTLVTDSRNSRVTPRLNIEAAVTLPPVNTNFGWLPAIHSEIMN